MNMSDTDEAAFTDAIQKRRLARQQKSQQRRKVTYQLLEEFDQFTQKRWATVKLLADHGFVEQSQKLAADVQILQDCCDANRALMGEHGHLGSCFCSEHHIYHQSMHMLQAVGAGSQSNIRALSFCVVNNCNSL
jgi:hypothetical protein